MYTKTKNRYLLPLMIATCAGSALAIGAIFADTVGTIVSGILGTSFALSAFALSGLACRTVIDQPRLTTLAIAGIVVSICGACLGTVWAWNIGSVSDSVVYVNVVVSFGVLAAALALVAFLLHIPPASCLAEICQQLTVACVALLTGYTFAVIWLSLIQNDVCFVIHCVFVVLVIFVTVLTFLLKKRRVSNATLLSPPTPPAHLPS
jgi:hypothetical protein